MVRRSSLGLFPRALFIGRPAECLDQELPRLGCVSREIRLLPELKRLIAEELEDPMGVLMEPRRDGGLGLKVSSGPGLGEQPAERRGGDIQVR
jgi:hypothetical protein